MYGKLFLFFVLLLLTQYSFSQTDSTSLPKPSRLKRIAKSITIQLDQRDSFVRSRVVTIQGGKIGYKITQWLEAGIGFYLLRDKLLKFNVNGSDGLPLYYARRQIYYGTIYLEPFILQSKYLDISTPLEIGFGQTYFKVYNSQNEFLGENQEDFFPSGAGLLALVKFPSLKKFKPLGWFGVHGLIGYRNVIFDNFYKTDYDGMYWSLGVNIFIGKIAQDLLPKKKTQII